MADTGAHILKRKMAASARDKGPFHLIEPLPASVGGSAALAFQKTYGEKCQPVEKTPASFGRLDASLEPHGNGAAIYHFRLSGEHDVVITLDPDTALMAAGWSLTGSRTLPDPKPEKVTAIDRRLAKSLAIRIAESIFENADASGVIRGGIELIASGDDPRRFDFKNGEQRVVTFAVEAKTIDGESLGYFTMIAVEKVFAEMRTYYSKTLVEAEKQWKRDLIRLAAQSPVRLRANLTEQVIDIYTLMNLKPGTVIDLHNATIDEIAVFPETKCESKLTLAGALGNRDGARALRIKAISY